MRKEASTYRELTRFVDNDGTILFGPHKISIRDQIFYKSKFSFAVVNLKPLQIGHVLVCPLRSVDRIRDLNDEELDDLASSVLYVHKMLHNYYGASGFNIGIQDGKIAGQSVPHVHVHLIPRGRRR